jgi:hypothetical protein
MSNVTPLPLRVTTQHSGSGSGVIGGGDGGDADMRERIAKLEANYEHASKDIADIKTDLRDIRNWGIAAVVGLAGMIGGSFLLLNERTDKINEKVSQVLVGVQQLSDELSHKH